MSWINQDMCAGFGMGVAFIGEFKFSEHNYSQTRV